MIGITAQNDADYYLSGGCARVDQPRGPAEYELAATEAGEPPGEWLRGAPLGLSGEVVPDDFRTLVNHLRDPRSGESLGARPRRYKTRGERRAAVVAAHPHATAEEVAALLVEADRAGRHAVHAYDVTFSLPKSWSVLHAALERAGRHDEAEQVWAAVRAGIDAALDQAVAEHGYARTGVHGPKVGARTTGRYTRATGWIAAMFRHHTSRDRDPQLHAHVMLLNRVQLADGRWMALHAAPLYKSKHALDATFMRVAETELHRRLGVHVAATGTTPWREIVGVPAEVRSLFSARSRAVSEEVQQSIDAWTARHGRAPAPLVVWRLRERATLASRRAKRVGETRADALDRWEEEVAAELRSGLADVVDGVDDARADAEGTPLEPIDPSAVIERAIADLEARKSTWSRSHLTHAISQQLPDVLPVEPAEVPGLLASLTEAALRSRELVDLVPPPAVKAPETLTDEASGRSVFEAPEGGRWTTTAHWARETSLVSRLDQRGAPALPQGTAEATVAGLGLSPRQAGVAAGILASDARVELVNAPAGTGKSYVTGALDQVSRNATGRGLLGLATARNAANVLRAEGVERATSIAAFLDWHDRSAIGEVGPSEDPAVFHVAPGDTVVIDEVSMVATPDLVRVMDVLDRAGAGRVILVGDTEQVDAVEHAGVFALLVAEREARAAAAERAGDRAPTVHRLDEVRRFDREWERDASTALRDGDVAALTRYDARGRVHGGDLDTARDDLVRDTTVDLLTGRDAVVVTGTAARAEELSSRVREALVRAGHVDRVAVPLADRTEAGAGDLIQTRHNDPRLGVVNRERWQVLATTDQGDLEARRITGRDEHGAPTYDQPVTIPAGYVAHHVALAYASTVHGVQGRTVDVSRTLVEAGMGRDQLYPAVTRGRAENHFYGVLDSHEQARIASAQAWVDTLEARAAAREPVPVDRASGGRDQLPLDGMPTRDDTPVERAPAAVQLDDARARLAELQGRAQTPLGAVADAIDRDDRSHAALTVEASERDRQTSIAHLGPMWASLVAELRDTEHRAMIRDVLPAADADRVLADPQGSALFSLLRSASATGHDARTALTAAAGQGGLDGARSPARVMYARVDAALGPAGPGPASAGLGFVATSPEVSTHHGRAHVEAATHARALADVMHDRTIALGRDVADTTPVWAVSLLGPAPADERERAGWGARAAPAAALREWFGITDERNAVGPQPTRAEPERLGLWNQAVAAAGGDYRAAQLAGLSRGELELREQAWAREQSWMPRSVDDTLRDTHLALGEARAQEVEARTAGRDAVDEGAVVLAMESRVNDLERVAEVRAAALDATRDVRDTAAEARAELDRRDDVDRAARDLPPARDDDERGVTDPVTAVDTPSRGSDLEREPDRAVDSGRDVTAPDVDPSRDDEVVVAEVPTPAAPAEAIAPDSPAVDPEPAVPQQASETVPVLEVEASPSSAVIERDDTAGSVEVDGPGDPELAEDQPAPESLPQVEAPEPVAESATDEPEPEALPATADEVGEPQVTDNRDADAVTTPVERDDEPVAEPDPVEPEPAPETASEPEPERSVADDLDDAERAIGILTERGAVPDRGDDGPDLDERPAPEPEREIVDG